MTAAGFLYGIYGQKAQSIDAELIQLLIIQDKLS
jgi:hypothetical protein